MHLQGSAGSPGSSLAFTALIQEPGVRSACKMSCTTYDANKVSQFLCRASAPGLDCANTLQLHSAAGEATKANPEPKKKRGLGGLTGCQGLLSIPIWTNSPEIIDFLGVSTTTRSPQCRDGEPCCSLLGCFGHQTSFLSPTMYVVCSPMVGSGECTTCSNVEPQPEVLDIKIC